jgi:glycosyltransferase involved in cell wall biosynthesis
LNPDLIASHFALYTLPWIDLIGARAFVVHFHGPWALEGAVETTTAPATWIKRQVERTVYRRADHFIVLSNAFKDVLCRTYDVSPDRVSIVPGGVDVDAFAEEPPRSEARALLGWPTDRPILFAVRRLAHRMGLERLIEAMATVHEHVPDARLYIAGRGPLRETLQEQIESLGLQDQVRLLGFISDDMLRRAYRAADLSIVPTIALEGFGLITIESLAAGTPVLVTPVGGLPEVVAPLSEDLVLPGAETTDLADGLLKALLSPERLPSTEHCIQYARRHFDWPKIAQQTRDVYADVLHAHHV